MIEGQNTKNSHGVLGGIIVCVIGIILIFNSAKRAACFGIAAALLRWDVGVIDTKYLFIKLKYAVKIETSACFVG